MKHLVLFLCLLLTGCGGVVGNINKYDYELSKPALDSHVEQLLRNYPDSREAEARYHDRNSEYFSPFRYLLLTHQGQRLVFGFVTQSVGKRSVLVLVYAAPLGDVLVLPTQRPVWEKRWYASLFETGFIDKLNRRLKIVK
ncbi:hypothetical protein [Hymenobacter arizonensis]|uniref:Lipoprotein n=1 Tax=Hymenobacter arizonensis TaxID=1227077 RepID=A0A1I6BD23_HYMAR|nr:hypothetical protein [Hymenobacter arizonensis]SFQ78843.1 hypothetical protein SAMN04515668_4368 [Hymenobacter arizonensis]